MPEEMSSGAGSEKVSSGPSESSGSGGSGSGPSGSNGSGSEPSSSSGECVCEVQAIHVNTEGTGPYQANCIVAAAGTCDVTVTEFTTSFGGVEGVDYVFSGTPFDMAAGTEQPFAYNKTTSPSGDEIFIHFICENGHLDTIGFTIP